MINPKYDKIFRNNLGAVMVATFGTETTKSVIQTACRGYRTEEYPDGIDVDTAQYLSSLVPIDRGFVWDLNTLIYGDESKDKKPVIPFIQEVSKYKGLLEIMFKLEGIVSHRGIHASGLIMLDEDPFEFGCFMKAPNGEITTQYDLHDSEWCGMTKYDFLVTEAQDKITQFLQILQEKNIIENTLTLREAYNKYLNPNVLPIENNDKLWTAIENCEVLDLFQFDSDVGRQAAKKIKPKNINELCDANGLMRLMTAEKGEESPMDKYIRFKNNISLWYKEMDNYGLTKEEEKILEPYFKSSYGVPPSQEQLMKMLMDENICGFTLAEANMARKIVGKKQMSKIPELKEKVLKQAKRQVLGEYVWKYGAGPQMGYSFSIIHALAYSFIGVQMAYAATNWNPIYWNTACLIVNSGSLEEEDEEIVNIYEEEDSDYEYEDLPDRSGKKKKNKTTNYAKLATAIGAIRSRGIKISLVDINNSDLSFKADDVNNQILFGLKGLAKINNDTIELIKQGRPYNGIKDFMERCPLNKSIMLSLIKGGAFDNTDRAWASLISPEPRIAIMAFYISKICEPKKKITLQNLNGLIENNLLPSNFQNLVYVFNFNKYIKKQIKGALGYYLLDEVSLSFITKNYGADDIEIINGTPCVKIKWWEKIYKNSMECIKSWIVENQQKIIYDYNTLLFQKAWEKNASGTVSAWEMDVCCFYYHSHELADIDTNKYGISDFNKLPLEPEVEYFFKRNGKEIPIFKLTKIIGTVIGKNDTKATISLLTTSGVVNVKFTKEYYAKYKKQISKKNPDGTKTVIEKGWFKRGCKLMLTGYRIEDTFKTKTYKNTSTHQIYLITEITNNGHNMSLVHERAEE